MAILPGQNLTSGGEVTLDTLINKEKVLRQNYIDSLYELIAAYEKHKLVVNDQASKAAYSMRISDLQTKIAALGTDLGPTN